MEDKPGMIKAVVVPESKTVLPETLTVAKDDDEEEELFKETEVKASN